MTKAREFDFFVCKPCWELKYCPYGPIVEHYPLSPGESSIEEIESKYEQVLKGFQSGDYETEADILNAIELLEYLYPPRWEMIKEYDTSDLECNVFGHVCPVFFNAEPLTETRELRKRGRYIPRDIMLKVVRRDGQICQMCHKNVRDDELEFDHLIPHSKGGPVSVDNLRVLCHDCNSAKSDSLSEILRQKGDLGDWFSAESGETED